MRASNIFAAALALLVLTTPALSQNRARDEIATVARALIDLQARWEANNDSVSRADLEVWTKRAAGTGNLNVILSFYGLFSAVAQRDGDLLRQIGGRLHVALARHAIDGALTSTAASANFELGQSFLGRADFRDAGQFALMNALSVANALVRAGIRAPQIIGVQAMSYALLGQSLLQAGRPGAAVFYLRASLGLANAAGFSDRNKTGLGNLLNQAQAAIGNIPPLQSDVVCDEAAGADEQRRNVCLSHAELLWARGNLAGVDDILSRLVGPFGCTGLSEAKREIVQRLMFVRALRYRPGEPVLRDAVCAVANGVAVSRPLAASALAMPTIRAYIDRGPYDSEIADLAAHIARRWIREDQDLFAWYFMEALSQFLEKANPPGNLSPRNASDQMRQQKLAQSLIALDRAYLAERNGWAAAGEVEQAKAFAHAEAIDVQDFERLRDDLRKYWRRSYGFMTPTPAAAAEFYARATRRLHAGEDLRTEALILWLGMEYLHRADESRAARIAVELIEQARRDGPSVRILLATLLDTYADIVRYAKPEVADNALREALTIYLAEPGYESARLEAMLKLESDRRKLGDIAGAERFFTEAMALRNSAPGIHETTVSLFDMRHALRLMDLERHAEALEIADATMQRLEAVTERNGIDQALVSAASSMAIIYARARQIERAREVYNKYILPWANPVIFGDAMALNMRVSLASLEAVYGPTAEAVKVLEGLVQNAERRAAGALELQESAWRSLAFAHHGMGAHREALDAARRSFTLKPPQGTESEQGEWDRRLAETHVAAAWRVSR